MSAAIKTETVINEVKTRLLSFKILIERSVKYIFLASKDRMSKNPHVAKIKRYSSRLGVTMSFKSKLENTWELKRKKYITKDERAIKKISMPI